VDLSENPFRLKEVADEMRFGEMLGLENLNHRYLEAAA
jgi:hypothetical protein